VTSIRKLAFFLSLSLCGAGCITGRPSAGAGFMHLFVRNLVEAPCDFVDDQWFKFESWVRARRAWAEVREQCGGNRYTEDFHHGFIEGYVDYLDAGGNGSPPAVPPARYWNTHYESPEGVRAIQDWFVGFRLGAEKARESGYRDTILVPLSTAPVAAPAPVVAPPAPPAEMAPAPRPVPMKDANQEPGKLP